MSDVKNILRREYGRGRSVVAFLADLILGGAPPKKPLPEIFFCPVIFANGRDDDTEGLRAFFENRPVMCRGEMVPHGHVNLRVDDLRLSVSSIWLRSGEQIVGVLGSPAPGRPIATVDVGHGFFRTIEGRSIGVNCPVQP
ncbi:hypothetical protein ACIQUB_07160 [Rhizobium sp. NPDC090275]|uniref:hypothetical protein n=1 Tax=Rhizobium sp. NPDC090275 TaxID=3364498 RepID=UPI00383ABAD2